MADYKIDFFRYKYDRMAEKLYKCDYCPRRTTSVQDWRNHIIYEIYGRIQTVCKNCGHNFRTVKNLILHTKRLSCRSGMPLDECKYCKKLFTHAKHLHKHLKANVCLPKNETHQWIIKFVVTNPPEPLFTVAQAAALDSIKINI